VDQQATDACDVCRLCSSHQRVLEQSLAQSFSLMLVVHCESCVDGCQFPRKSGVGDQAGAFIRRYKTASAEGHALMWGPLIHEHGFEVQFLELSSGSAKTVDTLGGSLGLKEARRSPCCRACCGNRLDVC
jgi:hypothetical protein